jgi:hypothetical protein
MKKRPPEEQIIRILKQAESGLPVIDLLRENTISHREHSTAGTQRWAAWMSSRSSG